jgi:hypothetical protein
MGPPLFRLKSATHLLRFVICRENESSIEVHAHYFSLKKVCAETGAETGAVYAGIFAKIQQDSDNTAGRYL